MKRKGGNSRSEGKMREVRGDERIVGMRGK